VAAIEAGRQGDREVGHRGWEAAREPRGKEGGHSRDVASRVGCMGGKMLGRQLGR